MTITSRSPAESSRARPRGRARTDDTARFRRVLVEHWVLDHDARCSGTRVDDRCSRGSDCRWPLPLQLMSAEWAPEVLPARSEATRRRARAAPARPAPGARMRDRDEEGPARELQVFHMLFGVGLHLQAAGRLTDDPAVTARLGAATDELDAALRLLRHGPEPTEAMRRAS